MNSFIASQQRYADIDNRNSRERVPERIAFSRFSSRFSSSTRSAAKYMYTVYIYIYIYDTGHGSDPITLVLCSLTEPKDFLFCSFFFFCFVLFLSDRDSVSVTPPTPVFRSVSRPAVTGTIPMQLSVAN